MGILVFDCTNTEIMMSGCANIVAVLRAWYIIIKLGLTIFDSCNFRIGRQPRRTCYREGEPRHNTLRIINGKDEASVEAPFNFDIVCDRSGPRTQPDNPPAKRVEVKCDVP